MKIVDILQDDKWLPIKHLHSESKRSLDFPTKFNNLSNSNVVQDIDDLSVVWLDANINQTDDCIDTELELRRLTPSLKTFTDLIDCVNYLTNLPSKHNRVFVVVSGMLGTNLLKRVQHLEYIVWIYVFCENESLYIDWAKQYDKIRGVFIDKHLLFPRLLSDIAILAVELTPMRIFQSDDKQKSIRDLNTDTASFMWFQLLLRIILTMCDNRDDRAKTDMINACLKRYQDDPFEQNRIRDFEKNYQTGQAIQWYTKDNFLYRSVNRAFRTADIDVIYQFRFIIAEIYDQLASLPRPSTDTLTVYRGQIISDDDMNILEKTDQKEKFVSMDTFLSTSEIASQATGFSYVGIDLPKGLQSVLLEISVGQTRQPFANIDALSTIPSEKEILFSAGTVFRVDKVEKYDSGAVVSLTLTTEIEERFDALANYFMSEIGESPTVAMFGRFLILQGDYNRAERYFQFLIDENGSDLDDIGRNICYTNLGYIFSEKGEYERAMDYFQKVLDIQKSTLEENHADFAKTYSNIGTVYMDLGQYSEARKNFELSLTIDLLHQNENDKEISKSYSNLAMSFIEMGDYTNAKINFEKALEKDEECGLNVINHPNIAITYHNLGSLHDEIKQHAKAIEYYNKALAIQKASLPLEHPSRIRTESCLSIAYTQLGDHKTALEKSLAVLDAKLTMRPLNFPSLAKTHMNLGNIYQKMGEFNCAEEQMNKGLQILLRHLPKDHPDTGLIYHSLGDMYDELGKTRKAMNCYQQALDIWQKQKQPNMTLIGRAYISLGSVEDNSTKAKEYVEQGLVKLRSVDSTSKELFAEAYNTLGTICQHAEQFNEAIENYSRALDLARESADIDDNDPSLSTYYHNLGTAYCQLANFEQALKYIQKAIDNRLTIDNPLHPNLGGMYNSLASLYFELDKNDLAIEYFQKAIDVFKQPNAQNYRLLAKTYESMGSVYDDIGNWKKAVDYYKMALEIQLNGVESNESDLVSTYAALASAYEDHEDYDIALTYFKLMLEIQEKILPSTDLKLADTYYRVGLCYHLNKQADTAIDYYKKVLAIRCQSGITLASIYEALADAYKDLNELNTASDYYEMSIESLIKQKDEENHVDHNETLCILHKNLGVVQRRLGIFDKAMENFNHSLQLYTDFLATDDQYSDIYCGILESMARLYEATNNQQMAEQCRAKKMTIKGDS